MLRPLGVGLLLAVCAADLAAGGFAAAKNITGTTNYALEYPVGPWHEFLAGWQGMLMEAVLLMVALGVAGVGCAIVSVVVHDRRSALLCLLSVAVNLAYLPLLFLGA